MNLKWQLLSSSLVHIFDRHFLQMENNTKEKKNPNQI